MYFKNLIKLCFNKLGFKVIKANSEFIVKHDPYLVQKRIMNYINPNPIIFDVSAYHGSVALRYNSLFPKSKIYCFEPFPNSFEQLSKNLSYDSSFKLFQHALGDISGKVSLYSNKYPMTNSILEFDHRCDLTWDKGLLETTGVIEVDVKSIDQLVLELNIDSIDILKMDVQGVEYKIIKGADNILKRGGVKLIYTEIITIPTYFGQLGLEDTLKLFKDIGFNLVGLYNYSYVIPGQLRQVDAIFIRNDIFN